MNKGTTYLHVVDEIDSAALLAEAAAVPELAGVRMEMTGVELAELSLALVEVSHAFPRASRDLGLPLIDAFSILRTITERGLRAEVTSRRLAEVMGGAR